MIMSLRRNACVLVGVIATLSLVPTANAQFGQFYDSMPFGAYEHSNTDQMLHEPYVHPFIEPGYFNHDLQFFAPADDQAHAVIHRMVCIHWNEDRRSRVGE